MIRSTFAGFNMSSAALRASQYAIDVAGQNLSNINTVGYTRQRLDLASINPVGASKTNSQYDTKIGQGVMMTGVTQIRDPYLDIQYRNQMTEVGTYDATDEILSRVGTIFDETDSTAIRAALNDVISQLKTMSSTPNAGEDNMDTVVRASFEILLNIVNQNAIESDQLRDEVTQRMEESYVDNVNDILKQISELNRSIKNSELLGSPALELKDNRNTLIDALSSYLPIEVSYETIMQNPDVQEMTITFTDTNGTMHTLIDDIYAASMEFGTIPSTQPGMPPEHSLTLTTAVDPDSGIPPVITDVTEIMGDGVLQANMDMLNKAGTFDGTDVRGLGYYEEMFDSFVVMFAEQMNYLNAEKDPTTGLPVIDPATGLPSTQFDLFAPADPTLPMSASNIKISDAWMKGEISINKTFEEGPGGTENSTGYENVLAMINMLSTDRLTFTKDIIDPTTGAVTSTVTVFEGTIQEAYDNIQNVQAIDRKSSSTLLENSMIILNQIQDTKDSVSSVSQDEEVMDLMRYQQSYNAASRLMTTLDEILDKLINSTGVVGR